MSSSSSVVYYRPSKLAPYLLQNENEDDTTGRSYVDDAAPLHHRPQQPHANPRKISFGGGSSEADAAAGGGGPPSFQQRVSSLGNLLLTPARNINPNAAASGSSAIGQQQQQHPPSLSGENRRSRINSFNYTSPIRAHRRLQPYNTILSTTDVVVPDWRLRDRMKTVAVGLILAVNVGTDPPDIVKPHPCAVLQCWIDPSKYSRVKAKELIGERLEAQYAKWQLARSKAGPTGVGGLKYRRALDPTVEDVRNLCFRLRNQARSERVLLHYNGHGVPRPSDHGEIWVFDKNHTEYIPLPVADLRLWIGKPAIVVLDCSSAGILIPYFTSQPASDDTSTAGNSVSSMNSGNNNNNNGNNRAPSPTSSMPLSSLLLGGDTGGMSTQDMDEIASQWVRDTIVLCPCSENEWLPMHPDYPADIFTSCLTTPIPMALRWFINRNPASMSGLNPDVVDSIPGVANDRKTPLGELNWIFTTVTDSIAWNILPKPLFARLFRQDLLVASMFRNFLLADRILRSLGCTPVSFPPLPPGAADHPLWQAWDLACETLLFQLIQDGILGNHVLAPIKRSKSKGGKGGTNDARDDDVSSVASEEESNPQQQQQPREQPVAVASSISSPFFSEQLAAFEVWLEFSEIHKIRLAAGGPAAIDPPEHLPVVLQVLLSQVHRIRALTLLRRFLVLGPWAVNLSLRLGIFPYVMKLLQSPEYKSLLVGIWASILAFDPSCRVDVLKDGAFHHFVQHFLWGINNPEVDEDQAAKERTLVAFVLAAACHEYPAGQAECVRLNLHGSCAALLSSYEQSEQEEGGSGERLLPAHFRLWLCICLGNMVKENTAVQTEYYVADIHKRLEARIHDKHADVRAAVCYVVGCMIGEQPKSNKVPSSQELSTQLQQQNFMGMQPAPGSFVPSRMGIPGSLTGPVHSMGSLINPVRSNNSGLLDHLRSMTGGQPIHMLPNPSLAMPSGGTFWNQPPIEQSQYSIQGLASANQPILGSAGGILLDQSPQANSARVGLSPLQQSAQFASMDPRIGAKPSVFEDRRRLALDLTSLGILLQAARDGSVVVRYEATIALGRTVAKYLDAFVAVADELSGVNTVSAESTEQTAELTLPRGLSQEDGTLFKTAWQWLRSLQKEDPFPPIAKAANEIVSVVHETLLRYKTQKDLSKSGKTRSGILGGIDEEQALAPGTLNSQPMPRSHEKRNQSTGESGHKFRTNDLRRVSSEVAYSKDRSASMEENAESKASVRAVGSPKLGDASSYSFPKSEFYEFKKNAFDPNFNWLDDAEHQDPDPLSPSNATQQYQNRRNYHARERGDKLKQRYACLAPKPPKPVKKSIQMILEEEDIDEEAVQTAEELVASRKLELEFREERVFKNDSVSMTSLITFHPYEDYFMACGDTSSVSMWDTQNGTRCKLFTNGNPKGSRMTSSCWINAESSSHFLVGCDDGTVRVWGGLLERSGERATTKPRLLAAFHAASMEADHWGSGLVCEWQSYSGTLIAGGNSKFIRCWDLEAEKVANKLQTHSDAYVTTLTTAWDHDVVGAASGEDFYYGIGKHIIVAGLSDGSIKLFDIRTNTDRRQHATASFSEHKSWVVTTAFTSYDGRYELISGTLSGEIKAWDFRMSASIRTLDVQRSTMTTLAVNPKIPIVATGSDAQFIKVVALDGDSLQLLRYHEKMANHRIGPVSCLAFHPYKPLLAAGATDSYIGMYTTKAPAQHRQR